MKSFVIFGGSGFVGRHLVKKLKSLGGVNIVVADIRKPQGENFSGVNFVECDVRNPIPLNHISGPSTVVNLAAVHRTPGHPDHEYFETNVQGAGHIVDFCEATGSNRLWFTSSISVYGPRETPCSEKSALTPRSAYGQSKLEAETIQRSWVERGPDRKLVIARPAVIFGAGENGNFTKLAAAMKRGLFVYPGRSDTVKGCGYVEDLIESLFFMDAQPERLLLYNFSYQAPYTIKDICLAFNKVAGFRAPLGTIPFPLMLNLAKGFQLLDKFGFKSGVHPDRIKKLVCSTNIVPGELSARGYPYRTDLEAGIRRWMADYPSGKFI